MVLSVAEQQRDEISRVKKLNHEFLQELLKNIQGHIEKEPNNPEWLKYRKAILQEQNLIDEILSLGEETGVLIDPQYWTIRMGFARRLGVQRLRAIRELLIRFVPFRKIQGHLKKINVQHEEAYLSLGCGGFFHEGTAEIPNYITFNNQNPENFYATFLHEAVGHPIGSMIKTIDLRTRRQLMRSYKIIKKHKSFFAGSFGRVYPVDEMTCSFDQFIAELTKQYCLEGEHLRSYIDGLPPEQREAYRRLYDFLREVVYSGLEFSTENLKPLLEIADQVKEKTK